MCGIAGYWGKADKKILQAMLREIAHRGPDDRGIYINGNIALGNNRLAIIDLSSRGRQPMFDNSKSICVVFNGEIYNFQNLKLILQKKYQFITNTDTEVLLYSYKEWGIKCLEKLNGMFSFVIYDKNKNLLFGARDRIGEKPLKYYFDGSFFAFASEIKGLIPAIKNKVEIDPVAINHYLTLQYVPAPLTGFKNIFKLPPGHFFIFKNGRLTIKKYWGLNLDKKLVLSEADWEARLLKEIEKSVKTRLISDVPLGVFLSGGVDSSALVGLISRLTSKQIKTFTVSFDDLRFDESKYAKLVSRRYGTSHKVLKVTNKMMSEVFTRLTDYYDEPFADNSAIPTLLLSKFASKYIKVALTGDGGDENFAGYERYNIVSLAKLYGRVPKVIRNALSVGAIMTNGFSPTQFTDRLKRYSKTFDQPFYKKYLQYSAFFDDGTKCSIYSTEFEKKINKIDTFDIFRQLYNSKLSDLDNALNFDVQNYLPEDLLFKTDIAAMTYSIEARAPFLNHELFELTAQMQDSLKIKFFNKKYIFKKLLSKNHLVPDQIIYRQKKGFVAPIDRWLKKDFKEFTREILLSKKFKNANIFDQEKLEIYLQNYFDEKDSISGNNVFALLMLSLWINKYL